MARWRGTDGRPRAGWRILIFVGVFYALAMIFIQLPRMIWGAPADRAVAAFVVSGLVALVTTLTVVVVRRRIDRKTVRSLGLSRREAPLELTAGFLFAGGMVALAIGAQAALGWARVEVAGISWGRLLLLFFATAGFVAWFEELVFRGYLFQNLIEGTGLRWAVALSCLIYGLVHLPNPHSGLVSTLIIAAIGFKHLYGWMVTGRLWLAMGMHTGWNFTQGAVFGMPVSGRAHDSIWSTALDGPGWISGGEFGIEAGLFGLLYAVVGVGFTWLWGRRGPKPSPRHILDRAE